MITELLLCKGRRFYFWDVVGTFCAYVSVDLIILLVLFPSKQFCI